MPNRSVVRLITLRQTAGRLASRLLFAEIRTITAEFVTPTYVSDRFVVGHTVQTSLLLVQPPFRQRSEGR